MTMSNTEGIKLTKDEFEKYSSEFSRLGSDYVFSRFTKARPFSDMTTAPTRLNGVMIAVILGGKVTLDVNLTSHVLTPNTVAVFGPDCLIHVHDIDRESLDSYVFIVSTEFLRDINLDINMLNTGRFSPTPASVLELTQDETDLMVKYFELIHSNTRDNEDEKYVRSISRNLVAAAIYQLILFARRHIPPTHEGSRSRRSNYVKDFMRLVHQYHRSERSVAFYASKLFISPKYLSLIVKEATGTSAAQWIDEFVILEAKNLLRFSGKNVQQIAYELNFTNQSSFGKYFKHITGMSPTEYQKS